MQAAKVIDKNSSLDSQTLDKFFSAAVETIQKRGGAKLGDKTMLDVLIPIRETFRAENCVGKSLEKILLEARDAARGGYDFAKTISAKKSRAASLGKKSIGFEDPGAASSLLIFRTILAIWKSATVFRS